MFASNRCSGLRGTVYATQAMIHSFRSASALSLRVSRDGAEASGQVCATASVRKSRNVPTTRARDIGAPILHGAISRPMVSNRQMRRTSILWLAVLVCACGGPKPAVTPARPEPTPAQRLASAEALVHAGCLDCLIDAYGEYDLLRAFPYAKEMATLGAVRAAGLIARRQRELGMTDDGYLARARSLAATLSDPPGWLPAVLDVVDALPASARGI